MKNFISFQMISNFALVVALINTLKSLMSFQVTTTWELIFSMFVLVYVILWTLYIALRASSKLVLLQITFCLLLIICDFATLYKYTGLRDMVSQDITHDGFISLYFSSVTITTLGYGDFIPPDNFCRSVSISEAMAGYFIFAVFVSKLITLFGNSRRSNHT
jgi:hypothetical protein